MNANLANPLMDRLKNSTRELHQQLESFDFFPAFYEHRYGDRGKRFATSDSAWLVPLSEQDQPVVDQQVQWLGRVLAARGMPQIMLETHL